MALLARRREEINKTRLYALNLSPDEEMGRRLDQVRKGINDLRRIQFHYVDRQAEIHDACRSASRSLLLGTNLDPGSVVRTPEGFP